MAGVPECEWDALAREHLPYAQGAALKCTGFNDRYRDVALSAAGHGLFNALRKFDKSKGIPLKSWIGSSVAYSARLEMWKSKRNSAPPRDGYEIKQEVGRSTSEDNLHLQELFDLATEGLSVLDRTLAWDVWVGGKTIRKAARVLGIAESTAYKSIRHARENAQERISRSYS